MIPLTKNEKLCLILIAGVVLCGSGLNYLMKAYPQLVHVLELMESERLYPRININIATEEELVSVPYIGKYTARQIIRLRGQVSGITSLDQLRQIKGVHADNFEKFRKYLKVK